MNRKLAWMVLALLMVSACAPVLAPMSVIPIQPTIPRDPAGKHIPVDRTPAQLAAIQSLSAKKNLPVSAIQVVSTQAVSWPDACLGVQLPGVFCMRGPVQGFRIVLSAGGRQYEYHTNQDGSGVLEATRTQVAPPLAV